MFTALDMAYPKCSPWHCTVKISVLTYMPPPSLSLNIVVISDIVLKGWSCSSFFGGFGLDFLWSWDVEKLLLQPK